MVKARTSAAALVEAGHVRINGVREKAPGHAVKAGDVLTVGLDRSVRILKIVGFSERRGDASAARLLYDDLQDRASDYLCRRAWKIAFRDCFASLAAVNFLRYANTAKPTRFGALDDLRRH